MPDISQIILPDGTTYDIKDATARSSADTKVKQNNSTDNADYSVLLSKSANDTTETDEANKCSAFKFNPSTRSLTAGYRKASSTIGNGSIAIGNNIDASSSGAIGLGESTTSNGTCSYAEGYNTTASGGYSHAEGNNTTASGSNSHAQGYYTTAQRKSQHVFGEYNELDTTGTITTRGDYVEIVGNGTGISARSNARTLDWSGNQWIAGSYKSDALTASKLLVSDANKNIISSSLAVSDLITTSNIGTQSVANATKWNNITYDMTTLNTTDTWIPVLSNGKFQHTLRDLKNSVGIVDWNNTTTREYLATLRTLAFWNGAHTSGGNSNLQYCDRGRFGTVITKNADDVVQTYTDNTFYKAERLTTFKGSNNALVGGGKGNYIWGISAWSDSRLKDNVKDSRVNALDIINNIKMREFDFIDEKYGHHEDLGYVAQELKEVIPECVIDVPISEEEQKEYKTDTLMQVEDKHLIKYLVKAMQELSELVQMQQKQIDELKDTIKTLTV